MAGRAQRLMTTSSLPRVYERWWRPALGRIAKGALGPGMTEEHRLARLLMSLSPGDGVLDVACGTGAFTREFARAVGPAGLAVGIDVSQTMLARAVREARLAGLGDRIAYMRGDAAELPFRHRSFDAVCCFAALNLMPDPFGALDSMTGVLTPGGRIALFTSARGRSVALDAFAASIERATGMHMFGRDQLVEALRERGYVEIRRRVSGLTQFVGGRLGE
ncbi:MAG: class I SAM-dependent methyltransferase [Thermoleophilaceae bacterium]